MKIEMGKFLSRLDQYYRYLILPLIVVLLVLSNIINYGNWSDMVSSISYLYMAYYDYIPGMAPAQFIVIYVLHSIVGTLGLLIILDIISFFSMLYIVDSLHGKNGFPSVLYCLCPVVFLYLLGPNCLHFLLAVFSVVLFAKEKYEHASLLLGLAIALNWVYILLVPSYFIVSKRKLETLFLVLSPLLITTWFIYYYSYSVSMSYAVWGVEVKGIDRTIQWFVSTFYAYFPDQSIFYLLMLISIIGGIVGLYVAKIMGIDHPKYGVFVLLIQILELEMLIPHTSMIVTSLSIHFALLTLLFICGGNPAIPLVLDAVFIYSLSIGGKYGIALYKISLILLVIPLLPPMFKGEMPKEAKMSVGIACFMKNFVKNKLAKLGRLIDRMLKPQYVKLILLYMMGLVFLLFRAGEPPQMVFDEYHYVKAAKEILSKGSDPRMEHPPLVKYLIALGILFLGDKAINWRIFIIPISALTIPCTYYIAKHITNSEKVAITSTLLLAFDPLFYSLSRLAMLDGPALGFASVGIALSLKYCDSKGSEAKWLYLSGLFYGLAISAKMTALMAIIISLAIVPFPKIKRRTLGLVFGLIIIPSLVLIVMYVPLYIIAIIMLEQQGAVITLYTKIILTLLFPLWVLGIISMMFTVYSRLPATQPQIESHPWDWIYGWKPIRGYTAIMYVVELGTYLVSMVILLANPFTWFVGLTAVLALGALYTFSCIVLYLFDVIIKKKPEIVTVLRQIKSKIDPMGLVLLWGFFTWLAFLPSALAHWFYWYYQQGSNPLLDALGGIVFKVLKEGRPSYIFYMYHLFPSLYVVLAIILDRLDKRLGTYFSIFIVAFSIIYFLTVYPVISGAVWILYPSIVG